MYDSGGNTLHVVVALLDDETTEDQLLVATGEGEDRALCAVGLMGWRRGESWEGSTWESAYSIEEAVGMMEAYWLNRESHLEAFKRPDAQ